MYVDTVVATNVYASADTGTRARSVPRNAVLAVHKSPKLLIVSKRFFIGLPLYAGSIALGMMVLYFVWSGSFGPNEEL